MKNLKKIIYIGEDERQEINIGEAIALLGNEVVAEEFNKETGKMLPVDADYFVRFVWENRRSKK